MPRFYVTTPIYYVNDAPHVGHAYTTVNADALARWHRLPGDDVFFLTGTDEHGHKVARAAAEQRARAPGAGRPDLGSASARPGRASTSPTTTSSAPPSPATTWPCRTSCSGSTTTATSSWAPTRACTASRCEAYYTEAELLDGNSARSTADRSSCSRRRTTSSSSSAFEDRLIEWYEANPEPWRPDQAQRGARLHQGRPQRHLDHPHLHRLGRPGARGTNARLLRLVRRAINYLTAIGYGEDEERFAPWWPAVHHLIGKEIIRFHCVWWPAMCMAAGIDPPAHVQVHGWLLVGGEKMSKTRAAEPGDQAHPDRPEALTADFGVDAIRYHLLRDTPLGTDGDFSYEGIVSALQRRPGQQSGQPAGPGGHRGRLQVRRDRARLRPDSPLAPRGRRDRRPRPPTAWERFAPHEGLEATWRLIREANADLEATEPWKAEPGPAVDAVLGDALEALRIVALLVIPAMPATAAEIWRRIGLDGSPADLRLPADAAWGGYPGRPAGGEGRAAVPRRKD